MAFHNARRSRGLDSLAFTRGAGVPGWLYQGRGYPLKFRKIKKANGSALKKRDFELKVSRMAQRIGLTPNAVEK